MIDVILGELNRAGPFDFGDRAFAGTLREEGASMAADRFLKLDAFHTESEFEHIRSIMEHVGSIDPITTLRASIDAADFSLALNWAATQRLARYLLERGRMGKDDLSAWFAEHPAAPRPFELRLVA